MPYDPDRMQQLLGTVKHYNLSAVLRTVTHPDAIAVGTKHELNGHVPQSQSPDRVWHSIAAVDGDHEMSGQQSQHNIKHSVSVNESIEPPMGALIGEDSMSRSLLHLAVHRGSSTPTLCYNRCLTPRPM